jgi:hypothetical protein
MPMWRHPAPARAPVAHPARSHEPVLGTQVLTGDAAILRQALGRLRPSTAAGQQAVAALQRYVRTHAPRMLYGELRQQGYAVASAAVESAHHGVVQRRLQTPRAALD